jgi:HlyD family secretion protein
MTRSSPRVLVAGAAVAFVVVALLFLWLLLRDQDSALEVSGTIEALEADLAFPFPGTVARVVVEEGDRVAQGDTIALFDDAELRARRDAAAAAAEAAEQRLAELEHGSRPQEVGQAEAAYAAAAKRAQEAGVELERARALYAGEAIPQRELDRAETAFADASAGADRARQQLDLVREGPRSEQIAVQSALVDQAHAAVEQVEAVLDDATLRAPFAGLVTIRHRDPGEMVPAGGPVATIMDPNDRWVRVYVREDAIGRVQIGQSVRITSDTYPDRSYEGRVAFIAQEAEFTPANVQTEEERVKLVYEVKVRIIRDPEGQLKVGTPADVTILPGEE